MEGLVMYSMYVKELLNDKLYNLNSKLDTIMTTLKLIDNSYNVDYRKKLCFGAKHYCCTIKNSESMIARIYLNEITNQAKIEFFTKNDCFPTVMKPIDNEQQLNYYLNLLVEAI